MPVTVAVTSIQIEPAPQHVYPKRNTAIFTVSIDRGDKQAFEMKFTVGDYENLNTAVEDVNFQLAKFADELRAAATQPLAGSVRNS